METTTRLTRAQIEKDLWITKQKERAERILKVYENDEITKMEIVIQDTVLYNFQDFFRVYLDIIVYNWGKSRYRKHVKFLLEVLETLEKLPKLTNLGED